MDYIACNYDAIITIPLATLHVKIYTHTHQLRRLERIQHSDYLLNKSGLILTCDFKTL